MVHQFAAFRKDLDASGRVIADLLEQQLSLSRLVGDKVDRVWVERQVQPKVSKDDVEQVGCHCCQQ